MGGTFAEYFLAGRTRRSYKFNVGVAATWFAAESPRFAAWKALAIVSTRSAGDALPTATGPRR